MKKIKKILIANRGEIAVRVIRTCREMGIATVVVFSAADRKSLPVAMADEAYEIGPAAARESYLVIDKIISVAKKSGADAIHPGYGFLSEKAEFSRACEEAGILFIGPSPSSIKQMGDKITARHLAEKAGVPTLPGTQSPVSDLKDLRVAAKKIGYPVLLKAAAGGGGKGMRVVKKESDLESAFQMAASEAQNSFHDDRVFVEKYITSPRHVEVQIMRDKQGQGFFLFERECSMQRRHQKIIEESPCPYLKQEVRAKMAKASLALTDAVDYHGAGTIEYLIDADQNFYFLEMNTRLQVEHTVTEMILDLDLVRLQILVAQGEKLKLKQDKIIPRGHAIQCRIYAEDPQNDFMPSPGTIEILQAPEGPGIRHDTGVITGSVISTYYDPMLAKLIVFAEDRELACHKMLRALQEYKIHGLKHNIPFLIDVIQLNEFRLSEIHTQFLDHWKWQQDLKKSVPLEIIFGVATLELKTATPAGEAASVWEGKSSHWRLSGMRETLS